MLCESDLPAIDLVGRATQKLLSLLRRLMLAPCLLGGIDGSSNYMSLILRSLRSFASALLENGIFREKLT